jgi:hypothetical protein
MWKSLASDYARRKREVELQLENSKPTSPVERGNIEHLLESVARRLQRNSATVIGQPPIRGFHTAYDAVMFQKPGGLAMPGRS